MMLLDFGPNCDGGALVSWAFLVTQPAVQETPETWVQSLDQEDALGKEMAIHSNILAWEIPWTEESGRLQSTGLQTVGSDLATKQQQKRDSSRWTIVKQNECLNVNRYRLTIIRLETVKYSRDFTI